MCVTGYESLFDKKNAYTSLGVAENSPLINETFGILITESTLVEGFRNIG